jgi:hypothetical protein
MQALPCLGRCVQLCLCWLQMDARSLAAQVAVVADVLQLARDAAKRLVICNQLLTCLVQCHCNSWSHRLCRCL